MRANYYIDGFNLYYCALKGTPYRWLDVATLLSLVFPDLTTHRIRYFTARVRATPLDPQKPQRQQIYLRALETIPCLSLHFGRFWSHIVRMPVAHAAAGGSPTVEVIRTDEKGTDVNLAAFLLCDGYEGEYEVAVIVSNDSDLVTPISLVRERLRLTAGVLSPQCDSTKQALAPSRTASFYRSLRTGVLAASQFPPTLVDAHGEFHKPPQW